MTVKLNLTVDGDTASAIKKYAMRNKTSVSKIAEAHFEKTIKEDTRKEKVQAFMDKFAGNAKIPIGENLKEEIAKAIEEKHGQKSIS